MDSRKQKKNTKEDEIISLLGQGDKKAISLLYDNYSPALYGIIIRTIPSEEIASEVLQDVFLKVWNNAGKYDRNKGKLFTWLVQIARHAAIDTARSGKYQRGSKVENIETSIPQDTLRVEMEQSDSGLRKVVSGLDEKYRILIDYIYFKGYTQSEVAEELNIPLGTVKTRVRTAILDLRKLLSNEMFLFMLFLSVWEMMKKIY